MKTLAVFAFEAESQNFFDSQDVLYTGVGKLNASCALLRCLNKARPTIVVNLGTAGSSSYKKGTIVQCRRFVQRDMDASALGFPVGETPFSGEDAILEYGSHVANFPQALCGTGDSFDIIPRKGIDVVDMEAYALARVCRDENIPFLCLKYVSDGADQQAPGDWGKGAKGCGTSSKKSV